MQAKNNWQIWIDTGGTFTDCLAYDPSGKQHRVKVLSSSALRGTVTEMISRQEFRINKKWVVAKDFIIGFKFSLLNVDHPDVKVEQYDPVTSTVKLNFPLPKEIPENASFEVCSPEEAPILATRLVTGTPIETHLPNVSMRLGTTRGTNALLQRHGAPIALFITKGFGDLLEIGNQQRPDLFALNINKPKPLYQKVVEVPERVAANGEVLSPLQLENLAGEVDSLLRSGIASGQKLGELRIGLSIAVVLGGLISMAVLVVGTSIAGDFTYQALSNSLSTKLGDWAALFFAFGLFAAGFSSAVTAPLAAAITAKSLFDSKEENKWHESSWRYRSIWLGVLLTGVFFGLIDVKPIPAIILAQALNGVLLPFVAVFLFLVVNDRSLMGKDGLNNFIINIITGAIVIATIVLGISNLMKAATAAFGLSMLNESVLFFISVTITLMIAVPVFRNVRSRRAGEAG